MRTKIVTCMLAGALVIAAAACGGDDDSSTSANGAQSDQTTATTAAASANAVVKTADSDLGQILTTKDGKTVYGFKMDTNGMSSCVDGCAAAWPPVMVDSTTLPAGLDADVFAVITRPDGTFQLKAGDWPLYTFMGDMSAGQTNGQGTSGAWFVVKPDGSLNEGDAAASSGTTDTTAGSDYSYSN